jgi:ribonuclease BN (tRNA processing enzyme)
MKCHLLGTGGSVNGPSRHNTSLFLQTGPDASRQAVLIDCNGACVQRLSAAGVAFDDLAHVFLTHEHIDHIAALVNLIHQVWVQGCLYRGGENRRAHALNIYANGPTIRAVKGLVEAVNLPRHPHMFDYVFHELDGQGGTVRAGDITLHYYPVNHGPTPCFGLYADGPQRRLVYSADTEPVPAIYGNLRPGDVLVHDCNKIDRDLNPEHTTWAQIAALLPGLPDNVITYLVHLPPLDPAAEAAFTQSVRAGHGDRVVVGTDGLEIGL